MSNIYIHGHILAGAVAFGQYKSQLTTAALKNISVSNPDNLSTEFVTNENGELVLDDGDSMRIGKIKDIMKYLKEDHPDIYADIILKGLM